MAQPGKPPGCAFRMEKEDQNARVVNRNGKWVALDANGDVLGSGGTRQEAAKFLAAKNNA